MNAPQFKVYDSNNEDQASAKEPHAAAMLAEHYDGTVKWMHRHVVWAEGDTSPLASFDGVSDLIWSRCEALTQKRKQ